MLVRCLYASRARGSVTPELLDSILKTSTSNNTAHGITGMLCFAGDVFVQILEGGRDEVCELYNRIARDERHTQVRLLSYEEIGKREFCQWTMGTVDLRSVNPATLLRYSPHPGFDPFAISGKATLALFTELATGGAVSARGP
jgi:hypothetical protein